MLNLLLTTGLAGSWEQDQRDGQGTYTYPNGDTFRGGWSAGQKSGAGTYFFKDSMSQVRDCAKCLF